MNTDAIQSPKVELFYERFRAIYALSVDYDAASGEARAFFERVHDKLYCAVTSAQRHTDVNADTLSEEEAERLHRLLSLFLDFADREARRRRPLFQHQWPAKLDDFLRRETRR